MSYKIKFMSKDHLSDMVDKLEQYASSSSTRDKESCILMLRNMNLNQDVDGIRFLHIAVFRGYTDLVKTIVDLKNDEIELDLCSHGMTPLMFAAYCGRAEIVSMFIGSNKVNVNAINKDGDTALHLAVSQEQNEIVKILTSNTLVNCDVANRQGLTALDIASIIGNTVAYNEISARVATDRELQLNKQKESISFDGNVDKHTLVADENDGAKQDNVTHSDL